MSLSCGAPAPSCQRRACQRHIRDLIAAPCPRTTSCRRVATPRYIHASVSATLMSASCTQYHVYDLIAFLRILIATPCLRMTSRRRVATPQRTRTVVSSTCASASRTQCHVRGLVAIVRNLIAVTCTRTTSCRRVATPHAPVTPCP